MSGEPSKALQTARQLGAEAARAGRPESACSYTERRGSATYRRAWLEGYRAAKQEGATAHEH